MPSIGRKWTLILLAVPLILGWICLLIPAYKIDIGTPALFYIGRILTGLGGGGFALAPNVYIAEASILTRRPVPSTDQALPSCFYFKIS